MAQDSSPDQSQDRREGPRAGRTLPSFRHVQMRMLNRGDGLLVRRRNAYIKEHGTAPPNELMQAWVRDIALLVVAEESGRRQAARRKVVRVRRKAVRLRRSAGSQRERRDSGSRRATAEARDGPSEKPGPPGTGGFRVARLAKKHRQEPRHVRDVLADALSKNVQPEQRALGAELRRQARAEDVRLRCLLGNVELPESERVRVDVEGS